MVFNRFSSRSYLSMQWSCLFAQQTYLASQSMSTLQWNQKQVKVPDWTNSTQKYRILQCPQQEGISQVPPTRTTIQVNTVQVQMFIIIFGQMDQKQPLQATFNPKEPPPLSASVKRPYKGIFFTYFLFFCGLLFMTHGFHRYEEYTVWDLLAVWVLSGLLMIPGVFFGFIILSIQISGQGYQYKEYPQLYH